MNWPLKILHLEDMPDDAELIAWTLTKSGLGCEVQIADNKADFVKALFEFAPDIILSDHSLPSFDSHEALKIVKQSGIKIPFILVTATVSEEYAVSIINDGASDYILKDRLHRLPSAITASLNKAKLESERIIAEETLRLSEQKYKLLFEANPMPIWIVSKATLGILAVNQAAVAHYGYTTEEFLQLNTKQLRPPEDLPAYVEHAEHFSSGLNQSGVWRHIKKDGTIIHVEIIAHDLLYENTPARLILATDVTQKLKAETELASQRILQQKLITETSIRVQEREREEIGKELHDNINQILATALLYLQHAMKKNDLYLEPLIKTQDNLNMAIEEIRKLSHTLVAPSLGSITLIRAIELLIENIRTVTTLRLTLNTDSFLETGIPKNIKLTLYRIIQEQVNNILRHSKATQAVIKLETNQKEIVLIISDNGQGADTNKTSLGIGLKNIHNRVAFYDGSIQVISQIGEGYLLRVAIPVFWL